MIHLNIIYRPATDVEEQQPRVTIHDKWIKSKIYRLQYTPWIHLVKHKVLQVPVCLCVYVSWREVERAIHTNFSGEMGGGNKQTPLKTVLFQHHSIFFLPLKAHIFKVCLVPPDHHLLLHPHRIIQTAAAKVTNLLHITSHRSDGHWWSRLTWLLCGTLSRFSFPI